MSSSSLSPAPARPPRTAGFTLVELMVAMVIAGILATALWQMVRSQAAFTAFESQREDAQENGRAALEIVAADVRAALPQGIVVARDTALAMALPKAWGVVCATAAAGGPITAAFPTLSTEAFTVLSNSGTGVMVNTSATSTPTWLPRPTLDGNRPYVSTLAAAAAGACPNTLGNVTAYQISGTNLPAATQGALIVLYQMVRYDVGTDEAGKWWVRRSNGMESGGATFTMVPLAGPLPSPDSVRFTYYSGAAATELTTAPNTTALALDSLSRVKLKVTTVSSASYGGKYATSRDSAVILLRNRVRALSCATGAPAPC